MTWKRAIAASALALAVVCGLASYYIQQPNGTSELESSGSFWQDDSDFWKSGKSTIEHTARSNLAAHHGHKRVVHKSSQAHAVHHHQQQMHKVAAGAQANKHAQISSAGTVAAHGLSNAKFSITGDKTLQQTYQKTYKKAYAMALAKDEATIEAETQAREDAEKQVEDMNRKKLRNLELQPEAEPEPAKVPADDLEDEVEEEQEEVEEEKKEVDEEKDEAAKPKKRKLWDSVAMGAKEHMHEGPYYSDGEERFAPYKHCEFGGCEPLEKAGVNVDSWNGIENANLHRTLPWPGWDPSVSLSSASCAMSEYTRVKIS
jgi:hypothetical protein